VRQFDTMVMKATLHSKSPGHSALPAAISDYALIGDCETAALVGRDGSIDWLCLPRFDSPACFAALLGTPENGRWQLKPKAKARTTRRYRPHSLVLETAFHTSEGQVTLTDFMPLREAHPRLIRIVQGRSGKVRMEMDLAIRFDYGLTVPWVTRNDGDLSAIAGPHRLILRTSVPAHGKDLHTLSEFTIKAGETVHFELRYGDSFRAPRPRSANIQASLKKTEKSWSRWAARCKYKGRWSDAVERSLITLKALTYAPTGGIVAAPTTSLPEKPGGSLNWDYRFCWLRDATFTLLALIHAGYHEEARRWQAWLIRSAAGSAGQLQIMYGVAGERLLREWEVPWLSGYRHSPPVRVGNEASEQLQLDVYGELADVLHQTRTSAKTGARDFDLQFALLEHLQKIWRQPDHGIWEVRGKKLQFTHSKVMAWVAFDRTIRGAELCGIKAPLEHWRSVRQEIHEQVCRLGFDSRLGSFVQSYGSKKVDASLLLLPLVGFLPPKDPRIVGTVRAIEQRLIRGGFVMRYRGVGHRRTPMEGAFLPCSFWLADYYELAGRHKAAERLVKRLLKVRNDLGLLSEEYHVGRKQLVGNFPQALSHVTLVNTIINLHTKHGPARQRSNSHAHRAMFL
jgi:GH15 family glucan-1,4-alpha-glucosidase